MSLSALISTNFPKLQTFSPNFPKLQQFSPNFPNFPKPVSPICPIFNKLQQLWTNRTNWFKMIKFSLMASKVSISAPKTYYWTRQSSLHRKEQQGSSRSSKPNTHISQWGAQNIWCNSGQCHDHGHAMLEPSTLIFVLYHLIHWAI
jgi:hypothetical protein